MSALRSYVSFPQEIEGRTRRVVFDHTGRWAAAWRKVHRTLVMIDTSDPEAKPIRLRLREPILRVVAHPYADEFTVFEEKGCRPIVPGTTRVGKLQRVPDPAEIADYDDRGNLVAIAGDAWVIRRAGRLVFEHHSAAPSAFLKRADRGHLAARHGMYFSPVYDHLRVFKANGGEVELDYPLGSREPTVALDPFREYVAIATGPDDGMIRVFLRQLPDLEPVWESTPIEVPLAMALAPGGEQVALLDGETILLFRPQRSRSPWELDIAHGSLAIGEHPRPAFDPTGRTLAIIGDDGVGVFGANALEEAVAPK